VVCDLIFESQKNCPAEIHAPYYGSKWDGECVMSVANVRKGSLWFSAAKIDVLSKARSGRPSILTEGLTDKVDADVRENRRFTVNELHEVYPCVS
jgi:hypothetical protein